jgi:hypothetical protein
MNLFINIFLLIQFFSAYGIYRQTVGSIVKYFLEKEQDYKRLLSNSGRLSPIKMSEARTKYMAERITKMPKSMMSFGLWSGLIQSGMSLYNNNTLGDATKEGLLQGVSTALSTPFALTAGLTGGTLGAMVSDRLIKKPLIGLVSGGLSAFVYTDSKLSTMAYNKISKYINNKKKKNNDLLKVEVNLISENKENQKEEYVNKLSNNNVNPDSNMILLLVKNNIKLYLLSMGLAVISFYAIYNIYKKWKIKKNKKII